MGKMTSMMGITQAELPWLRMLVFLLRHPDSHVGELTRGGLIYIMQTSAQHESAHSGAPNQAAR